MQSTESVIDHIRHHIDHSGLSKLDKDHAERFFDEMVTLPMHPAKFRSLAFAGAPDSAKGCRAAVWMLMLGYLVNEA